jgi:DNA-binding transcriptional ArsR family regulator
VGVPARRQAVRALMDHGLPITRACAAVGISRSSFGYESRRTEDVELLERIKEIREKKPRWGYKRVHAKLRKEGFLLNHKRTERIWRECGFTRSARRRRKKVRTGETVPEAACAPNHVWTYDFMFDATFGGRRMKVLSLIDEFTREALAIVPARSLTASAVKAVLTKLFASRGRPATITRQWTRIHRLRADRMARSPRRINLPHRSGQALAEQLCRILQQPATGRMPEHHGVLEHRPCQSGSRIMAERVQHRASARLSRLSDSRGIRCRLERSMRNFTRMATNRRP